MGLSRNEDILESIINGTPYALKPLSREEALLLLLKDKIDMGGSSPEEIKQHIFEYLEQHGGDFTNVIVINDESAIVEGTKIFFKDSGVTFESPDINEFNEIKEKVDGLEVSSTGTFFAEYGVTSYEDVLAAINDKKNVVCKLKNTDLDGISTISQLPGTYYVPMKTVASDEAIFGTLDSGAGWIVHIGLYSNLITDAYNTDPWEVQVVWYGANDEKNLTASNVIPTGLSMKKYVEDELKTYIKTVNGTAPDENGNVSLSGDYDGSGVSQTMAESLWALLSKVGFATAPTQAEVNTFKQSWNIGGTVPPVDPDEPTPSEITFSYLNGVLTINNAATITSMSFNNGVLALS